jgi:hypothetical protein
MPYILCSIPFFSHHAYAYVCVCVCTCVLPCYSERVEKERNALIDRADKLELQASEMKDSQQELRRQLKATQDKVEELRTQLHEDALMHNREIAELTAARDNATELAEERVNETVQGLQEQLDNAEAQRNNFKQKCDSMMKELSKAVKSAQDKHETESKLASENDRMREELVRKSRSLADALEALGVYMAADMEQPHSTVAMPPPPSPSELVASDSKTSVNETQLMQQNETLQGLANKLSIDINEKDDIVSNLRRSNQMLGKQVIQLKERIRELQDDAATASANLP